MWRLCTDLRQLNNHTLTDSYRLPKLKPSKCSFFQNKTGYLGYVISSNGIETDPLKIEAVTQWRISMNVDDIRRFLGLTNYYHHFVENYAKIAKPLTDLLGDPKKKHGKGKVTQVCMG